MPPLSRLAKQIEVWSTVVWIECFGRDIDFLDEGLSEVEKEFIRIGKVFSTFDQLSEVSLFNEKKIGETELSKDFIEVWNLCELGKKYDTDKSSQRNNVTNIRHCHPYTLFYDGLFRDKKNENLKIAELGILDGGSLLMWREYFTNAQIYGFEYDEKLIHNFKSKFNNDRITLIDIDVRSKDSIIKGFEELNTLYDVIIEDTTHQFEDQIRVIENAYQYLKPGGILIIEDIFKRYNESDYINRLTPILQEFQNYYFIELDHVNRNSTGWDNDKLFILVKGGDEPIFVNKNKITIITPSYRVNNLLQIKKSINFK